MASTIKDSIDTIGKQWRNYRMTISESLERLIATGKFCVNIRPEIKTTATSCQVTLDPQNSLILFLSDTLSFLKPEN